MRWPNRLLTDIAAECSHHAGRKVTPRMVKLGLSLRYRSDKGASLDEAVAALGFTRRYGRAVCQLFGLSFRDFTPRNPNNLPLE
jgi:hypothetical protein